MVILCLTDTGIAYRLYPYKILSFSEYLHKKCLEFKIEFLPLKYYLPPAFSDDTPKTGRHYFFWYRGSLRFSDIKAF